MVLVILAALLVFNFNPVAVFAQEASSSSQTSFELFWPLSAGRTVDDPLYPLKILKESIRGFFIFGNVPKTEYSLTLGTKRMLEVEQLIKNHKNDAASKTLQAASSQFDGALKSEQAAIQSQEQFGDSKKTISDRLTNLEIFLKQLISSDNGQFKNQLEDNLSKVKAIHDKL